MPKDWLILNKKIRWFHLIVFITGDLLLAYRFIPMILLILNGYAIFLLKKEKKRSLGNLLGILTSLLFAFWYPSVAGTAHIPTAMVINVIWLIYPVSALLLTLQVRKEQKERERIEKARTEKRLRIKKQEARARFQYKQYQKRRQREKELERRKQEKEAFQAIVKQVMDWIREGYTFSVDTNVLLDENSLSFLHYLLEKKKISLHVSMVVLNELDRNKTEPGKKGAIAREAIRIIEHYQKKEQISFIQIPANSFLHQHSLNTSPDDRIIGGYLAEQKTNGSKITFLTNDRVARVKATALGFKVYDPVSENNVIRKFAKV